MRRLHELSRRALWLMRYRPPVDRGRIAVGCGKQMPAVRREGQVDPALRLAGPELLAWIGIAHGTDG